MGISILAANKNGLFANNEITIKHGQDNKEAKGGKSIFAGSFNLQNNNNIELKRKLAQKRAMKIVSDTFASEQKIDGSMDEMRAQQEQLKQETLENKKSIKEIQEQREKLMGDYNVTEESQEHKDLELLRKETSGGKLLQYMKTVLLITRKICWNLMDRKKYTNGLLHRKSLHLSQYQVH